VRKTEIRTVEDAIDEVKSGMTVGIGHLGAEPLTLTEALWHRAERLQDVTLVAGMMVSGYPFLKDPDSPFRLRTWFMPGTLMSGDMRDVRADYLPMNWTQSARYLMSGVLDLAIVQVSEADADGFHSLGISASQHLPMVRGARRVIAEVNAAMPRTHGDAKIHASEIDIIVHADHPLIPFPNRVGGVLEREIGRAAAEWVPDGAWLQFGIGAIPGAMLDGLIDRGARDLRILSQVTDPARSLLESGCCDGPGPRAVIGEILGTQDLYHWSNDNEKLFMTAAFTTHELSTFLDRGPFVSVNSALEIDLLGQVNSEWLGGKQVGAIGGAMDFGMAAQLDGNLSVIALGSATNKGKSRIVPMLQSGPVSVPRSLVQVVVTEYGSTDLRGLSVNERARALASISHPDHREVLERAASELY